MNRKYIYMAGILFVVSFIISSIGVVSVPVTIEWRDRDQEVVWRSGGEGRYEPNLSRPEKGEELVLIYIGSKFCGFSNKPDLPSIVDGVKREVSNRSEKLNYSFATIGIAQNRKVLDGLEHLSKFSPFDEISTGRGWMNGGLIKYVWDDIAGNAATPQVLIVRREIDPLREKSDYVSIGSEKLVIRKIGYRSIKRWYKNGAYLPSL